MMQAMTKLVEQGDHFVMGKQSGFTVLLGRTVEITGQISDRLLQCVPSALRIWPTQSSIHARRVCVRARTESGRSCAQLVIFRHTVRNAHFRVPDINVSTLFGSDAVNTFHHFKQAIHGICFPGSTRDVYSSLMLYGAVFCFSL